METELGELVDLNPRAYAVDPEENDSLSFVPMAAVQEESGHIDAAALRPYKEVAKGYTRFQEGDVIFAKITPCMENGKVAVARGLAQGRAAGSTEFHVLRPHSGIRPELLFYFLVQREIRRAARLRMKGAAGQLRVPPEFLADLPFKLPPSTEQDRVVSKIEALFSDLDSAIAALKRVQANLKRYRASVLKAACEGRLVPTEAELARKERRPYETGEQLLARILQERRAKWEADQLANMIAAGKPPKNDDWKKKYKEPQPPDTSNLPELPEGWTWASVSQLGHVQLGRQRSPKNRSKHHPVKYIRAANITEQGLDFSDLLDMEFTPEEQSRYRLNQGDVVLSEASGSPTQVGKPAVWRSDYPDCCFQNTVIRLAPLCVIPEYLLVVFKNYYWNRKFARIAEGVGINHLGANKFGSVPVPVAPLSEQARIVSEVEKRTSVSDKLAMQTEADLCRADSLRQSILKRAFEGKLVLQDPNEEPASVLLERIRAERAAKSNGHVKSKQGRRKAALMVAGR